MYSGFSVTSGQGTVSCVYLATVLSFVDLIPFFYIYGRPPPHLNRSPPPTLLDVDNQQVQRPQTWSQLFAECSYQQNRSEQIQIVCFKVFDPLSVSLFAVAFALAIVLLIFNLITMARDLTIIERVFRTFTHAVYALELFSTALVYYINRYWCFDCKELVFICIIPILTTMFMTCNWHQCNEERLRHRRRTMENQRVQFRTSPSPRSSPNPLIIIQPQRPSENNADPQLENEYNDWLEAQRKNTTQQQQI